MSKSSQLTTGLVIAHDTIIRRLLDQLLGMNSEQLLQLQLHEAVKLGCNEQKIVVHGSGLDCSKFAFTPRHFPEDNRVRIATTERLVEKKGIEYCIKAIAKLADVHPNTEYNIIGDGHLKADFEKLIQELNVSHLVKLLGWKQQQEIIEILDKSHIFLAPSVTAADGNQDAPVNTLKEAMAMGLPVISTFHGGIPELVEDGISGFLVPEKNADAIATELSYLIENPQLWGTIIKPLTRRLSFGFENKPLKKILSSIDKALNRYITDRYSRILTQRQQQQAPLQIPKSSQELSRV